MRVLIADDDRVFSQMILALCQKRRWRAMAAYDAMQALMFASKEPRPDVVLLDLRMPGGDGIRTLERIRASSRTASLPVIVVSGTLDEAQEARLEELGVSAVVRKPPDLEALADLVETVVRDA